VGLCRPRVHEAWREEGGGKWDRNDAHAGFLATGHSPQHAPVTPQEAGTLKGSLILEAQLTFPQRNSPCKVPFSVLLLQLRGAAGGSKLNSRSFLVAEPHGPPTQDTRPRDGGLKSTRKGRRRPIRAGMGVPMWLDSRHHDLKFPLAKLRRDTATFFFLLVMSPPGPES
jgi:hypothetical protein